MSVVNTEKVPKDRQLASVEQQTISLLKLEIEALQTEVAEKDGRLIDLAENANSGGDVDCESNAQLQRLIAELEQNDDRISDLEDALRASEEVAAADDAERRELQNWVDEIENRIAEKEEEWIAERDVLNRRLEDANDQYAAMLRRLEDHAQSGGSGFQDSMLVLRSENDSLFRKLSLKESQCDELRKQLSELEKLNREDQIQRRVEDQVRSERLQLAQERAVFSRQKLELTKRLQTLQQELEMRDRKQHPADHKFQVFRERLKELHDEEKATYVPPTLTQKLKRLWDRLDGPTDRD